MSVNYADVRQAQDRIRRFLNPTPIDVLGGWCMCKIRECHSWPLVQNPRGLERGTRY